MLANRKFALDFEMRMEGGFVADPHDPGGATNHGITVLTLSRWLGRPATAADVRSLTTEMAEEILDYDYFAPVGFNGLPAGVDLLIADLAVNSGPARALLCWGACKSAKDPIYAIDQWRRGFWRHLATFKYFGLGWFRREDQALAAARQLEKQSHVTSSNVSPGPQVPVGQGH